MVKEQFEIIGECRAITTFGTIVEHLYLPTFYQNKKGMELIMKIYFKTILMLIKTQLEYRKAFILSVLGSFLVTFLLIISVYFLFEEFNQIGNWTFYEVAFLFGMVFFCFSLRAPIKRTIKRISPNPIIKSR